MAQQSVCYNNLREIGMALTMYCGDYYQYPGDLRTTNNTYVWQTRLLYLMANNRKAYYCPAALPQAAWDTNINKTLAGPAGILVLGEDGKIDPFAILTGAIADNGTRFSLGYNDWGLNFYTPQLGLGGDVDGSLAQGPVRDTMVRAPAKMIAIGDVRSDAPAGTVKFNANMHIGVNNSPNPQFPCNRHNYRTDLLFADGHAENPLRNDVINPTNAVWRACWNNDNDPHWDIPNWSVTNTTALEQ